MARYSDQFDDASEDEQDQQQVRLPVVTNNNSNNNPFRTHVVVDANRYSQRQPHHHYNPHVLGTGGGGSSGMVGGGRFGTAMVQPHHHAAYTDASSAAANSNNNTSSSSALGLSNGSKNVPPNVPQASSYYSAATVVPHSRYTAYMQPSFTAPPVDIMAEASVQDPTSNATAGNNNLLPSSTYGGGHFPSSHYGTNNPSSRNSPELPTNRGERKSLPQAQASSPFFYGRRSNATAAASNNNKANTATAAPDGNSMYRYPSAVLQPQNSSSSTNKTNNPLFTSDNTESQLLHNSNKMKESMSMVNNNNNQINLDASSIMVDQDDDAKSVANAILNVATGVNLTHPTRGGSDDNVNNKNDSSVTSEHYCSELNSNSSAPQNYSSIMAVYKKEKENIKKPKSTTTKVTESGGATPSSKGRGRGRGRGGGRGRGRGRGKKIKVDPTLSGDFLDKVGGNVNGLDSIISRSPVKEGAPAMPPPKWYAGHVALGLDEDKFWLSELQVYLRSNFAEAFGATDRDIAAPMHGRNKPIALGQVGIRCMHCRDDPPGERGQQAVSYPSLISGIYNSVQQMFRLHFDCCLAMPSEVRRKIETLRASSSSRGGRKQYWIDSAKRLGLVDTPHGIHFGRDPNGPLPPLSGPSAGPKAVRSDDPKKIKNSVAKGSSAFTDENDGSLVYLTSEHTEAMKKQKENAYPLVMEEDRPLISDYLYLTLEQMEPCRLMDADRVGCYKGREVGFPGLACKHCVGQAGCGRYFPASEASLSQTTTSQTILNHVRNCRRCPIECRENLELMKRAKLGPNGKKFDKPKHGGRKVFFHRLWCRIQGLPINEDDDVEVKVGRQKGAKNKKTKKPSGRETAAPVPKRKRKNTKLSESDSDDDGSDSDTSRKKKREAKTRDNDSSVTTSKSDDDETETEDEDDDASDCDSSDSDISDNLRKIGTDKTLQKPLVPNDGEDSIVSDGSDGLTVSERKVEEEKIWHDGCLPLGRSDDPHWLSETQCFVRSDMIQAFTLSQSDLDSGMYDTNLRLGQVGIRCKFCGESSSAFRPKGHVYFPSSVSNIYQVVSDLQRRHFNSCNQLPDDLRRTYKSLRGFAAKAEGDTQQYWLDSARELGMCDIIGGDGGVRFFRDPSNASPADRIEIDLCKGLVFGNRNVSLIRPEDKGVATEQALLLLLQVRPCRFKGIDRRGGPGSRGRDRALGFPGIACRHCPNKNSIGRYFPVAAKTLADNTANSIQAHLMNCTRCPESVKASLAYLKHRSSLQKVELGGGWKRTFFKRLWDRLHNERVWAKPIERKALINSKFEINNETNEDDENEDDDNGSESILSNEKQTNDKINSNRSKERKNSQSDMEEMVRAAAIWLSERDANDSHHLISRARGGRGRGLPGRFNYNSSGRGNNLSPKRQRVL